MRSILFALVALALAAPAAPAAALSGFRLPPGPSEQQQLPPDRQGPVAPDVPESRRPPPTAETPAPQPAAPTPVPTLALPPPPAERESAEAGAPPPARPTPAVRPAEAAGPAPVRDEATDEAAENPLSFLEGLPEGQPAASSASAAQAPQDAGGGWWPWALAALLGLGVLALAGWLWRRRESEALAVPEIERPRLAPEAAPVPPAGQAAPAPASSEPLQVTLEPLRLSLTLLNATLAYRLEVVNRGAAPIVGLQIGADMIAAHASMSREEQLAGPGAGATALARVERLEPGESRIVSGEFRVPFSQIVPIRQGNAALLLPLARFRLAADGARPAVRTFAVGQPGPQAGLQPFRLDLGPRVYPNLAQRAFA